MKTVSSQPDGSTTTTLELHCKAVPGAVVRHNEKTTDEDGRVFNVGCWS